MRAIEAIGLPDPRASGAVGSAKPATQSAGTGFGERMANALSEANKELVTAENVAGQFARGEVGTLEAVVAMSKADLTLRHLVTLRNRALESLQEVLRMPL